MVIIINNFNDSNAQLVFECFIGNTSLEKTKDIIKDNITNGNNNFEPDATKFKINKWIVECDLPTHIPIKKIPFRMAATPEDFYNDGAEIEENDEYQFTTFEFDGCNYAVIEKNNEDHFATLIDACTDTYIKSLCNRDNYGFLDEHLIHSNQEMVRSIRNKFKKNNDCETICTKFLGMEYCKEIIIDFDNTDETFCKKFVIFKIS